MRQPGRPGGCSSSKAGGSRNHTELLLADHAPSADFKQVQPGHNEANELLQLAARLGCDGNRFAPGHRKRGRDLLDI